MRWGWIAVPLSLLLVGYCARPAGSADLSLCGPRAGLAAALLEQAGEVPVAGWAERDGTVRELFANAEADTWTLVVHQGGLSCTQRDGQGVHVLGIQGGGDD